MGVGPDGRMGADRRSISGSDSDVYSSNYSSASSLSLSSCLTGEGMRRRRSGWRIDDEATGRGQIRRKRGGRRVGGGRRQRGATWAGRGGGDNYYHSPNPPVLAAAAALYDLEPVIPFDFGREEAVTTASK